MEQKSGSLRALTENDHHAWIWHDGRFWVKRNKLAFGACFGSIEVKTPKLFFKNLFVFEKHYFSFVPVQHFYYLVNSLIAASMC